MKKRKTRTETGKKRKKAKKEKRKREERQRLLMSYHSAYLRLYEGVVVVVELSVRRDLS